MSFKSPLNQVFGLGSAGEGTSHWWHQRLTAIALVPLGFWFVASLAGLLCGLLFHQRENETVKILPRFGGALPAFFREQRVLRL